MAKNYVQHGEVLQHTASGADIVSGQLVVIGAIAGVALADIADGDTGSVQTQGVFTLAKATGAITQGAKVYYSSANSNISTTASGNTLVGVAASAQESADTTVNILLNVGL